MRVPLANQALYQLSICNIRVVLLPRTNLAMVVVLVLATSTETWGEFFFFFPIEPTPLIEVCGIFNS